MVSNETRTGTSDITSDTMSDTKYTNLPTDILRDTVFTKNREFLPRGTYNTLFIDFVTTIPSHYTPSGHLYDIPLTAEWTFRMIKQLQWTGLHTGWTLSRMKTL